jgi:serine/threonine-protein kinase HipA
MAGRPSRKRALDVWMNGELVGQWTFAGGAAHTFTYAASWLDSPNARPLSLSLPLAQGTDAFTGDLVEHYFDNLLPDSLAIRKRIAARFSAGSTHAFDLIEKIGRDCVGAVMLLPAGADAPDVRKTEAQPLSEAEVERLLDDTIAGPVPGADEEDELRISIAGAQEKTALLWQGQWCRPHGATPTTHILKLPLGEVGGMRADFSTSVENEWLCSLLAKAFGLEAADSEIQRFGRHKVLVVKRFDRRQMASWLARLPQEDFCQALGYPSELKYENKGGPGMAAILDKLRGSANAAADRENFLAAQLLFWLLAAPDGHAKNFSIFLEKDGAYRLTPLYDVLSAWPVIDDGPNKFQWKKVSMAMALRASNAHYRIAEMQRRHWNDMARRNAVGSDFEATIERFIARAPAAIEEVAAQLPADFPASVADPIFEGIRSQVAALERQG